MEKIIEMLILAGYSLHKVETLKEGYPVYVMNYNSVRNWVEANGNTIRMVGIPEGTDGETTTYDTGTLQSPSINFIEEQLKKIKETPNEE